jgi:hypothetical protein
MRQVAIEPTQVPGDWRTERSTQAAALAACAMALPYNELHQRSEHSMKPTQSSPTPPTPQPGAGKRSPKRLILMTLASLAGLGLVGVLVIVFALAMAYPNLPALDTITDYRPKMPLRIFTADNVLIGEFGEERRTLVHFKDIPDVMRKAVLAIEDSNFYEHGGIDYLGILRATLHNATGGARQGASTITQQVARNFFLSSEQTMKRKAYEPDLPGPARVRLLVGGPDLFRQGPEGHHGGRGGDAGWPAEGAVGLQPGGQPDPRAHPPAVHPAAHAPARLHQRRPI